MKIYLPNSAHLQNIEGFVRKYEPTRPSRLQIATHPRFIHLHPFAMVMAGSLGVTASRNGARVTGSVPDISSTNYLTRMNLVDLLGIEKPKSIFEHEEAGRFVPLTRIKNATGLRKIISDMVPLLHAEPNIADPIRYIISELGRNVLEHAYSQDGCVMCAQYFRSKKRIAIGMADSGVGIFEAIRRSHPATNEAHAIQLALTPGVSGATNRIGGNERNAGAGLFFTRGIAKASGNFFVIYSGRTLYKLRRSQKNPELLHANPFEEDHKLVTDLPKWQGTVVGIDISVDDAGQFADLLAGIREQYSIDVKKAKKKYFKKIKFT